MDCGCGGGARRRVVRRSTPSGPGDRPSAIGDPAGAAVVEKASGPACAAKTRANLDFTLKDINGANVQAGGLQGQSRPAEFLGDVVRALQARDSGVR